MDGSGECGLSCAAQSVHPPWLPGLRRDVDASGGQLRQTQADQQRAGRPGTCKCNCMWNLFILHFFDNNVYSSGLLILFDLIFWYLIAIFVVVVIPFSGIFQTLKYFIKLTTFKIMLLKLYSAFCNNKTNIFLNNILILTFKKNTISLLRLSVSYMAHCGCFFVCAGAYVQYFIPLYWVLNFSSITF